MRPGTRRPPGAPWQVAAAPPRLSARRGTERTVDGANGKRWVEVGARSSEGEAQAAELAQALGLHPLAARVLAARGHGVPEEAARFLEPALSELPDPFSMKDMDRAVE